MRALRIWPGVGIIALLQACAVDGAGGSALGSGEAALDGSADGSGSGAGGEAGFAQARFEPEGSGFFRMPWPSDARLRDDGTVELGDFPRAKVGVLST